MSGGDAATLDRLRLARAEGVGPITYRRLLRRYASAAEALAALPDLARAGGRAAAPRVPTPADAARECDALARLGGRLQFLDDPDYPAPLAMLEDAPAVLHVLGAPEALAGRAVALVGSRNASLNGQRLAETLAADLARAGLAVVSGLARGIDAAAHLGALGAGRTVACVAGGLDVPYPPENAPLQARIAAEGGAVVSEAPLGTAPQARHFPRRNRVIAGLSLGVVVVEAALRSGSLVTARLALDAGRQVFAVPGSPLDPRCRGCNGLIREGAILVEEAADVLDNLPPEAHPPGLRGLSEPAPAPISPASEDVAERAAGRMHVLELLGPAPCAIDDLARRCQLSAAAVNTVLLEFELAGRVEMLPGGRVALLMAPG